MSNEVQKIFVDGIESVTVIDGILHVKFFSYLPGEKDKAVGNKLKNEISLELITSLNGIMRIHETLDKIVLEMRKISKTNNTGGSTDHPSVSSANFN